MPTANNDILRVVAKMSWNGLDVQNVYHLKATVTTDPGDLTVVQEIAAGLDAAYDHIDAYMPNDIYFDSVQVWNATTDTYLGQDGWPTLTGGALTTFPLPPQNAPLVLFNTNVNRSQGRKFLPTFAVDALDSDGTLGSGILTGIGFFIADILTGISGTGWSGTWGNYNVDLVRFVPWVTGLARDIWATQRRRYFGKGT